MQTSDTQTGHKTDSSRGISAGEVYRLLHLTSLQSKLIIPYVLLTLLIAIIGTYIVTRLVASSIRERFVNQIYEASRVASDGVVRLERRHLEDLRLMAFTQGVPEAFVARDSDALQSLLMPLAINNGVEIVSTIDLNGNELFTLSQDIEKKQFHLAQGVDFSEALLVQKILSGNSDQQGDKYIQILDTPYGPALFTSAPVRDSANQLTGVLLVGTRLDSLLAELKAQSLADLVILGIDKKLVTTTLTSPEDGYGSLEAAANLVNTDKATATLDLRLYNRDFQITYTPFVARKQVLGWLGVVLPSSYVVATEATSRNILSLLFTLGTTAVILIGYMLSQSIAKPILRLRNISQAVAAGDLNQRTGLQRLDEIGDLASAFDLMTLHLRERTAEAERLYAETMKRNQQLAEINSRLQATQAQLIQSEKLAAIGQLTAGIVHDVKNPLTVIKGLAEFSIIDEGISADMKQDLQVIRDSAEKANRIVSDLLKFARQNPPEMKHQDLRETVDACLRLTAYQARAAQIQVIKDLPEYAVIANYDSQQIEQVLINLINNAVQAISGGGVIKIALSRAEGTVALAIQDSGTGIPEENLSRIFDPFFTTKPEGVGTGLGLSVSYGIVASHHGQIEVESQVGHGTTFTILLPIAEPVIQAGEQ